MSVAEAVAELVHNGVSLAEVAGLDPLQMRWVYFRDRDQYGALVREEEKEDDRPPISIPQPFGEMFKSLKRFQSKKFEGQVVNGKVFKGWSEEDIERLWLEYLQGNPKLKEREARDNGNSVEAMMGVGG